MVFKEDKNINIVAIQIMVIILSGKIRQNTRPMPGYGVAMVANSR